MPMSGCTAVGRGEAQAGTGVAHGLGVRHGVPMNAETGASDAVDVDVLVLRMCNANWATEVATSAGLPKKATTCPARGRGAPLIAMPSGPMAGATGPGPHGCRLAPNPPALAVLHQGLWHRRGHDPQLWLRQLLCSRLER